MGSILLQSEATAVGVCILALLCVITSLIVATLYLWKINRSLTRELDTTKKQLDYTVKTIDQFKVTVDQISDKIC